MSDFNIVCQYCNKQDRTIGVIVENKLKKLIWLIENKHEYLCSIMFHACDELCEECPLQKENNHEFIKYLKLKTLNINNKAE